MEIICTDYPKVKFSARLTHLLKNETEFRFDSSISILEWNNWSDFGRKSENYIKDKVFSDSRPKSAQKLILNVFLGGKIFHNLFRVLKFLGFKSYF